MTIQCDQFLLSFASYSFKSTELFDKLHEMSYIFAIWVFEYSFLNLKICFISELYFATVVVIYSYQKIRGYPWVANKYSSTYSRAAQLLWRFGFKPLCQV